MAPKTTATTVADLTTLTADEPLSLIAAEPPTDGTAEPPAAPIEDDLAAAAPVDVTTEPTADPISATPADQAADLTTAMSAEPLADPTITVITASAAPDASATTPDAPAPREPTTYALRDNNVILTGRVVQRGGRDGKKGQDGRYTRLAKGGEWLEYRIVVDEEIAPGVMNTTQIPIIIPRSNQTMAKSLRSGGLLQVRGRLDRDTEFDSRFGKDTAQGGAITDRVFIKVGQVDVLDASAEPRQQAILHVSGIVQAVVRVGETLGRHDTQKFHLVRLKIVERYPRQAPASGTFTHEQIMQVAVPADDPAMLRTILRPGNPVALELAYRETLDWASDNHHSMQGISEEDRDRLRKQTRSYLIATLCAPADGATALTETEVETILETARTRQQKARTQRRQGTQPARAEHPSQPAPVG